MTHKNDYTLIEDLTKQGLETIPELVRILINNAMQVERAKHLKAKPYERSPDHSGYANSYKPKTVKTKVEKSRLMFLMYVTATSILQLWKKGCAVKEP